MRINSLYAVFLFMPSILFAAKLPFDFNKTYEIYEVKGKTVDELEDSFEQRPGNLKVNNFYGYTAWQYNLKAYARSCKIKAFNLQIKYTLPRLDVSQSYPQSIERYKDFLERLYRHEEQHCAITLSQLAKMHADVVRGQSGDCAAETERMKKIDDDITTFNQQFDAYTNHGAIELAVSLFGEDDYLKYCKIDFLPFMNN